MTSIQESTPQATLPIRPLDGVGHSSSPTGASARLGAIAAVTSYNPTTPPMNVNGALTQYRAAGYGAILGQEQDAVGTRFNMDQNLSGQMDDVYVYSRALSESEVQTLYSGASR